MAMPSTLLSLGVTLHLDHAPDRREHIAQLASRLGFGTVWLPVDPAAPPDRLQLAALARAAAPARLGVLLPAGPPAVPAAVAADPATLVELDGPDPAAGDPVAALGGPEGWRTRAHVRAFDAAAAGTVVSGTDREALLDRVARTAAERSTAGRSPQDHPVTVALTVSIGRTRSEAEARALRDLALSGPAHPRRAGLFGTLEEAQEQALALRRAGADAVRATLADEQDVADLLAQLRSVAVGPTPLLHARGG
ncbi:MAG: hypothetical protein ACJ73E_08905 [Mycobacteriales bacterium]